MYFISLTVQRAVRLCTVLIAVACKLCQYTHSPPVYCVRIHTVRLCTVSVYTQSASALRQYTRSPPVYCVNITQSACALCQHAHSPTVYSVNLLTVRLCTVSVYTQSACELCHYTHWSPVYCVSMHTLCTVSIYTQSACVLCQQTQSACELFKYRTSLPVYCGNIHTVRLCTVSIYTQSACVLCQYTHSPPVYCVNIHTVRLWTVSVYTQSACVLCQYTHSPPVYCVSMHTGSANSPCHSWDSEVRTSLSPIYSSVRPVGKNWCSFAFSYLRRSFHSVSIRRPARPIYRVPVVGNRWGGEYFPQDQHLQSLRRLRNIPRNSN